MIKKIVMENLVCVNCTNKIEKRINRLDYVNNASFNFTSQIMTVDFKDDCDLETALKEIKEIVFILEDGVKVYYKDEKEENTSKEKSFLYQYWHVVVGLIFFVIAFIFNDILSIKNWAVGILYWIGYLVLAYKIIISTIKAYSRFDFFGENTLMLVATIAAMFLQKYDESIAVILLYSIGEFLQKRAVDKSKDEISSLINLQVEKVSVLHHNSIKIITPDQLKVGDILVIKNGERVPVDGVVVLGTTNLNSSALTGESKLSVVREGDEILSGNINVGNVIHVKVTKSYDDSTLSKIINLIENSTSNKSKHEVFITKFSKIYTPIILASTLILFIIPACLSWMKFSDAIYRAAMFLVISCPCSLVLSIPLSYFAGIGKAAKNGILFKGSSFLQTLTDVNTIALDKTGTLTYGDFFVSEYTNDETLKTAASIEKFSNHPIAQSIYKTWGEDIYTVENVKEIPGYGITGTIDGKVIIVGNSKLLKQYNIEHDPVKSVIGSNVLVALDGKYLGRVIVKDELKETSMESVRRLTKKYDTVMLTGDNEASAHAIAQDLGGIEYYSELLPQDKLTKFSEIEYNGSSLFVGDGINDAPLLKKADIGVSMGDASDIAIDVADIIITSGEISDLEKAFKIAHKTKTIVLENIIFSFIIKALFLTLSAFGITNMFFSILADVGVTLLAVFNSLRIIYQNKYIEVKDEKDKD